MYYIQAFLFHLLTSHRQDRRLSSKSAAYICFIFLREEFELMISQGAGNSIFTLMHHNENPELVVYATDYSAKAIEVVKVCPDYPTLLAMFRVTRRHSPCSDTESS